MHNYSNTRTCPSHSASHCPESPLSTRSGKQADNSVVHFHTCSLYFCLVCCLFEGQKKGKTQRKAREARGSSGRGRGGREKGWISFVLLCTHMPVIYG